MEAEKATDLSPLTDSSIQQLKAAVDELYDFRDYFFENHTLEEACKKPELVKAKLAETIEIFDKLREEAELSNRARYFFLRGRALNVTPEYDPYAEEALSKALKLDARLVEAWNELGDCCWRKNSSEEAKNCFQGALNYVQNKVSLRNLSIALRQEADAAKTGEDRIKLVFDGLSYAKEAVSLDTSDGTSWGVLGNAHLTVFFNIAQKPECLKQALIAYQQAEKDPRARSTPEFHFNKGVALKYDEEYEKALEAFTLACSLDPTWEDASAKCKDLLKFLASVDDLTKHKGKLRPKKLQQMLKSIDTKLLGPYQDTYKNLTLTLTPFSELVPGPNKDKVILGKVVCSIYDADGVPFTFCLIDKKETTIAVTVYNVAQGKGVLIGDSVAIPEPCYTNVLVKHDGKEFKYGAVRVNTPVFLVVNGKRLGRDYIAGTQLCSYKKPD